MGEILGGIIVVAVVIWIFGSQAKDLLDSLRALFTKSGGDPTKRIGGDDD